MFSSCIKLPHDVDTIADVDEEVFFIYTALQQACNELVGPDGFKGLGHVDSRKDTLDITFEYKSLASSVSPEKRVRKGKKVQEIKEKFVLKEVQVCLAQDKTALRTRKGDTGSVLWRASVEFANAILQQINLSSADSLFDASLLAQSHVLELGAGTGLLGVVLSPFVLWYTATDVGSLLPLIRKNMTLNFEGWPKSDPHGTNISVEELDWQALHDLPMSSRRRYCALPAEIPVNLVLVVDCIYHPSLLPSLVETIDFVSISGVTTVLVVVELRSPDVVREFLDLWTKKKGWQIVRLPNFLDLHYAVWMGQKQISLEIMV